MYVYEYVCMFKCVSEYICSVLTSTRWSSTHLSKKIYPVSIVLNSSSKWKTGFVWEQHFPYSTDLAWCDFFLFLWVKMYLKDKIWVKLKEIYKDFFEVLRPKWYSKNQIKHLYAQFKSSRFSPISRGSIFDNELIYIQITLNIYRNCFPNCFLLSYWLIDWF